MPRVAPSRPRPTQASLPSDVRTGPRTLRLRANRLVNAALMAGLALALVLLFLGVYRGVATNALAGLVVCAIAVVLAWAVGRRLGPGRLLALDVDPDTAELVNALQPRVVVERTAGLRAVIWVARRYQGAAPKLRAVYLVDDDGVRSTSKPATFTAERLERFFAAAAIPVELVDAERAPFPGR